MKNGIAWDRLWVPVLTHYRIDAAGVAPDCDRMAAHMAQLRPHVSQILLAGSTGDGWEQSDENLVVLVKMAIERTEYAGVTMLVGALAATTDEVIARARLIEAACTSGPGARVIGLTICPPVAPDASQEDIRLHYERVIAATESDIAIYQLPQVTGCSIDVETMRDLAANPRVTMFKDTSGTDTVVRSGFAGPRLVRGAEGSYLEALDEHGYDGWLLSTGNGFAPSLRRILYLVDAGDRDAAARLSVRLGDLANALFAEAAGLSFGNAFSNANRTVDHLHAVGAAWRNTKAPLTISGQRLPKAMLEAANDLLFAAADEWTGYYVGEDGAGR